ncbi:type II toxin-antitoxin system VapC family toxin [Anabaena sp. UHCC 0253]|uniref:PIN domain-containing protein n=1 Tax=Anabaena sp. UHCC 0253 TaxID=2590019 RepID=UPI001447F179|nr:PIN domain-containing protein [Anabaena sp. UHCC 0253]MTJ53803.1 type II toxin-antitoxin system VapC family toxin [Anabaena sp. UHCC 0253]
MIRVYLDTSIYNRPFDDQTQPKIFLETQAVILILQMVEVQLLELVSSSVLEYENSRNPFTLNQQSMARYLQIASLRVLVDENIRTRAKQLEKQGIKPIDALHVAIAEASQSNYFITCDRRLINRCQDLLLKVINPTDLILEMEDDY